MALRNPPTFLQAGQHPAENTRLALSGVLGSPIGVFAGGVISDSVADGDPGHGRVLPSDFRVTENGTPNMSVNVAAGAAWIRGTESATQGSYHVISDDTENLVIDTADATNARRDLIVVRVKDEDYSGSDNEVVLEVVTGTAAGSPVDPAVPDNALVLARVTVPALASSITNSDIADFAITPVGLRFAGRLVFSDAGTFTFTKADYPWLRAVEVVCQGGGGAGGGTLTTSAGQASMGSGGGAGGYAKALILAPALGASETITVPAAAAGVSGSAGSNGGTASFGSLVSASGGGGGFVRFASTVAFGVGGGSAGTGSGGQPSLIGQAGQAGYGSGQLGFSGSGGASVMGSGAPSIITTAATQFFNGTNALGHGGGGSGGIVSGGVSVTFAGGNGAPGVVTVDLYA